MKKILLSLIYTLLLSLGNAQAAFTSLPNGDYQMLITGGCFTFGDCSLGTGAFYDNGDTDITTSQGTIGSGIAGDGAVGVIEFSYSNGNIAVTSFSQDSYLSTAGGTFYLQAPDTSGMSGTIDNSGNMTFTPTGRVAVAQFFSESLGVQPWNIPVANGGYDQWTTGNSSNALADLTGSPLQDSGSSWIGTLVIASEVGPAWGFFINTPYTEIYNVTISSLGAQVPRAKVRVAAQGGTTQECSQHGGSLVTYSATVELFNGGELNTIDWLLDGEVVSSGTDTSFTTYTPLGTHTVEAIASLVTGETGQDSESINIRDTQRPNLSVNFIDARTHESITEISDNEKHYVEIEMLPNDICDPAPSATGTITPVFTVQNTDIIKVKAKKGQISMPSTALNLRGIAVDSASNPTTTNATLTIMYSTNHSHDDTQ